jgi:hypothetical protein
MVNIHVHLFGKPGWELKEGEEVNADELRALGEDIRERLHEAADIIEKLTGAGWDSQMLLYDICLSNPYVVSAVQAEEKLHDLGIDPEMVHIHEWEDEEDFLAEELGLDDLDEEDLDEESGEFGEGDEEEKKEEDGPG